jgi:hypothetical protein
VLFQQPFNELADKKIYLPFASPMFWAIAAGFILFTGLLAGIYPAFYLSSFQPARVLKGTLRLGRFGSLPRKVLVVVQFTVSVVLVIGTLVVYRQVQFARDRPVGYSSAPHGSVRYLHENDQWAITRIFEHGSIDDVLDGIELYGRKKVIAVLTGSKLGRVAYVMAYFSLGGDPDGRYR